ASSPPPRRDPTYDHRIGFPAETALLLRLHQDHGTLALPQIMAPAIRAAQTGFIVTGYLETQIAKGLKKFSDPEARALFAPNGRPIRAGERLRQTALARTLMRIAADHGESFYRGDDAHIMVRDLQARGAKFVTDDFASFRPRPMVPLTLEVGAYRLIGTPPPSSAIVALALIREWFRRRWNLDDPADAIDHLRVVRALINLKHSRLASCWQKPLRFLELADDAVRQTTMQLDDENALSTSEDEPPEHTTHLVVWDKTGMIVTMTLTLGTHWGTKDFCPLGFFYNSEGLLFRHAGHTFPADYPTTVGPISAKSPVLVLKDRKPLMAIGGAGSNRIVANVGTIAGAVLFGGHRLEEALHAPRRMPDPQKLYLEWGTPDT
ncbi:MAG TPA: gamma-glutamyltransferase, partial [Candidatus Ozemobacteraceae bacterium]|nr:gamma-glutamyltransferase [Candidatus Ozemobacteraceae bacterium]